MSDLNGATAPGPENAYASTPGEFSARWNSLSEEHRQQWLDAYNAMIGQEQEDREHGRVLPTTREEMVKFFGLIRLPHGPIATGHFVDLAMRMVESVQIQSSTLHGSLMSGLPSLLLDEVVATTRMGRLEDDDVHTV